MQVKYDKQRVYARPDKRFEDYLTDMYNRNTLSWNEPNHVNGARRVDFFYEGSSNATMLNPIIGQAPFWHPLTEESPNRVYEAKQVKALLNRTL